MSRFVKNFREINFLIHFQTMVEWLTQRPSTLLSSWLSHMVSGLKTSGRYSVLIEITHGTLEKVRNTKKAQNCVFISFSRYFAFDLLRHLTSEDLL